MREGGSASFCPMEGCAQVALALCYAVSCDSYDAKAEYDMLQMHARCSTFWLEHDRMYGPSIAQRPV